jgi:hypothetical protein
MSVEPYPFKVPHEVVGKVRQSIMKDSLTALYRIGTKYVQDRRTFRYCKAGAALGGVMRGAINGNIIPGDTGTPGYEGAAGYAWAAGDTVLQVSDTATTHTADYYADGYMTVFSTQFETHYIKSSTASDGTSLTITIDTPLDAAVAASGVGVTLYPSMYSNILAAGGVQADFEAFVVVPPCAVTSGYYFWGQTLGPAWVTAHGGTWPGAGACLRDVYFHTDGTIDPATIRDVGTLSPQRAGYLYSPSATSAYGDAHIMLQLE